MSYFRSLAQGALIITMTFIPLSAFADGTALTLPAGPKPPALWFVYVTICVLTLISLVTLGFIAKVLQNDPKFSLAAALSEETTLTATDGSGKPTSDSVTQLSASSSRVIAFLGSLMIMLLFVGFGVFVLYYFATGQGVPGGLDKVINYLLAGLTLFAPYVVNKFSGLFDSIAPKPPRT